MSNKNISEQDFLASIKRIERQYVGGHGSRSAIPSQATKDRRVRRPPDEAGYSLGKALVRSLLSLSCERISLSISKECQEMTFGVLVNRDINPAVCQGFFDALSESFDQGFHISLDDFFTACILFADRKQYSEENDYLSNDQDFDSDTFIGPLTCMVRAYAHYIRFTCERDSSNGDKAIQTAPLSSPSVSETITTIYTKLQTQSGRLTMLRELTDVAFVRSKQQRAIHSSSFSYTVNYHILDPLLTCSTLLSRRTLSEGVDCSTSEALLYIEGIWRQIDIMIEDASKTEDKYFECLHLVMDVIRWITEMLNIYLVIISSQKRQRRIVGKELAHRWLARVLDIGLFVAQSLDDSERGQGQQRINDWFDSILSQSLVSYFMVVPSYRVNSRPLWTTLQTLMKIYASHRPLSLESTLKISTLIVCHPCREDVKEMLSLLSIALEMTQQLHPSAISIIKGLGSIFSSDPICGATVRYLSKMLAQEKPLRKVIFESKKCDPFLNSFENFKDSHFTETIMSYCFSSENDLFHFDHELSAIQQFQSLMLFGIGLLDNNDDRQRKNSYTFLEKLLQVYPHLGISLLPVLINSINDFAVLGEVDRMIEQMRFLSEVVVRDPQSAYEIWNFLGKEFMRESIPVAIRSSMIRLFPKVCQANKKLYKKIVRTMSNVLLSSNTRNENNDFELRLAIAASTADLARDNLIRDPTDVISWLQDFISDTGWVRSIPTIHQNQTKHEKEAIVYHSILALNSLVVAGELDLKLVFVVLRKKLCDIHNVDELSRLPHLVLESLIILLGTCDIEGEDSSDDDGGILKAPGVSPQDSRSVEILLNLWNHNCLNLELFSDPITMAIIFRCKRNILVSLANYSFEALGVDEEGVESVCSAATSEVQDNLRSLSPNGARYNDLKHIIREGLEISNILEKHESISLSKFRECLDEGIRHDFSASLTILIRKILKFEEEALGSSLWQKRQSKLVRERNTKVTKKGSKKRPHLSKQLTSPKSILNTYYEKKDNVTCIGALLSFEGEPLSILPDLIINTRSFATDAVIQILYFQSFLNAARSALRAMVSNNSITESLDKLINCMQDCKLDNPDSTFMFLSAVTALIPSVLGPCGDFTSYMSDLSNNIWEAYRNHMFEDSDAAKFCLGLLGICNLSLGSTNWVMEIVDCLEKSTAGYGGLPNFGAYYALAVIAQKCATFSVAKTRESQNDYSMVEIQGRIVIFLINELAKCIKGDQAVTSILVTSIENGSINPKGIDEFTALQKASLKIKKSKRIMSKQIFIALGICLPGIATVNEKVLPGILCFLETFEWGSGVGFCLHPILYAWYQSNSTNTVDIEKKLNEYSKSFDEGKERHTADFQEEILYAMSAIGCEPSRQSIDELRKVRNEEMEDSMSLLLAISLIAKIPCLGNGGCRSVSESPRLLDEVTYTDVSNVAQLLSETTVDKAIIMQGFLASLIETNGLDRDDDSRNIDEPLVDGLSGTRLPEAHLGTGLEIVMSFLHTHIQHRNNLSVGILLNCFEVLALPNQFSNLVKDLLQGEEFVKSACVKLLVAQIKGRPRAVFDGRDFVKLALEICKIPTVDIRKYLGEKEASELFVDSFEAMLPKCISQDIETVIKNVFQFCIDTFDENPTLIITYLKAIKRALQKDKEDKVPRLSPKCLKTLDLFLDQSVFLDLLEIQRDTKCVSPYQITEIVEAYAGCIALVSATNLFDNQLSRTNSTDFSGECMRIRLLMCLIRNGPDSLSSRSHQDITSSIAWMSQQLISCNEGVFLPTFLQVACTVIGASSREPKQKKKEILVSFLDNLLLADSTVGFVCVEILSAFVHQFCCGCRSDSDSSMLRVFGPSIEKWVDLPPQILKKTFHFAVHDLSFNLVRFTRREDLSGIVFNRLSRIYGKWLEQGSDETVLAPLRLCLLCCRDDKTTTNALDDVALVTSIISKRN